jgi:hypothetical protein
LAITFLSIDEVFARLRSTIINWVVPSSTKHCTTAVWWNFWHTDMSPMISNLYQTGEISYSPQISIEVEGGKFRW